MSNGWQWLRPDETSNSKAFEPSWPSFGLPGVRRLWMIALPSKNSIFKKRGASASDIGTSNNPIHRSRHSSTPATHPPSFGNRPTETSNAPLDSRPDPRVLGFLQPHAHFQFLNWLGKSTADSRLRRGPFNQSQASGSACVVRLPGWRPSFFRSETVGSTALARFVFSTGCLPPGKTSGVSWMRAAPPA